MPGRKGGTEVRGMGAPSIGGRAPYTQRVDEEKGCCEKRLTR